MPQTKGENGKRKGWYNDRDFSTPGNSSNKGNPYVLQPEQTTKQKESLGNLLNDSRLLLTGERDQGSPSSAFLSLSSNKTTEGKDKKNGSGNQDKGNNGKSDEKRGKGYASGKYKELFNGSGVDNSYGFTRLE